MLTPSRRCETGTCEKAPTQVRAGGFDFRSSVGLDVPCDGLERIG